MSGSQQLILGEGAGGGIANYIEDVFSTWLYAGTGSAQTITNGIDLSTKGGLVWNKIRSTSADHYLMDSARNNFDSLLSSNTTAASVNLNVIDVSSTGFSLLGASLNNSGQTYASWSFRKQAKFFDVVTWTGNGVAGRQIPHSLGSEPGCIIVKNTSTGGIDWQVYHRSLGNGQAIFLNLTNAAQVFGAWNYTSPTATNFTVSGSGEVNGASQNYVAYLFAHDAGGFGLTGTDNVITCGSYTGNGSTQAINLGYEPQWLLIKGASGAGAGNSWMLFDNMRGMSVAFANGCFYLNPNESFQEQNGIYVYPTATGFQLNTANSSVNFGSTTYIYIAIRRGPMKTPTTGTSVFVPIARTGTGTVGAETSVGFASDWMLNKVRPSPGNSWPAIDRLRGNPLVLIPNNTNAELNLTSFGNPATNGFTGPSQNSYYWPANGGNYNTTTTYASYFFRRAPGFFDVVCYTGSPVSVNHNLGVTPEMIIAKSRADGTGPDNWAVATSNVNYLSLNLSNASLGGGVTLSATSTTFDSTTVRTADNYFAGFGGVTAVAYLFASCPGVSKVGSYTGTGALQTINCGFTGGARFVLIKRTDSTGDWFVYDSARGISSGDDPYLLLNTTDAEVTGTNYVATTSVGFQVTAAAPAGLNENGGTYIFLAIA